MTARSLALSHGSRLILERVAVWNARLPATAIHTIHVSQRGGFGRATMTAEDVGLPALGYVVSYAALQAALAQRLEACAVPTLRGARVTQIDGGTESARVRYERAGMRRAKLPAVWSSSPTAANWRSPRRRTRSTTTASPRSWPTS